MLITPPPASQAGEGEVPSGTGTRTPAAGTESSARAEEAKVAVDRSLPDFGPRWRVSREADGNLILEPVEPPPVSTADTTALDQESPGQKGFGECGWSISEKAVAADVKLPVNSWTEAHAIAQAWLKEEGRGELKVGKIRQVLRIYLVSIVGASEPFPLEHQLAIRAKDGLLIPIY